MSAPLVEPLVEHVRCPACNGRGFALPATTTTPRQPILCGRCWGTGHVQHVRIVHDDEGETDD